MWITIGVSAAVLVLCCAGGIFGFGALIYSQSRALPAEATVVVRAYLDGLTAGDYRKAYDQLCSDLHSQMSLDQFTSQQQRQPQIQSYVINGVEISGSEVLVDVRVETETGGQQRRYHLIQDQRAGGLRICGSG
jgi:hypothetical protein